VNYLNIATFSTTEKYTYNVFWSVKRGEAHIVRVLIDDRSKSISKIAVSELAVARYLLVERKIFGEDFSGQGLELNVSKKITLDQLEPGSSNKGGYASFFLIRHYCAIASKLEDTTWTDSWPVLSKATIVVDGSQKELVENTNMNTVAITLSSVQSYMKCNTDGDTNDPFKSLVKRIANKELREVILPEKENFWKKVKYSAKKGGKGSIWKHSDSILHFVVSEDNRKNVKNLITVFQRNDDQLLKENKQKISA
jgi:hypothetical protein